MNRVGISLMVLVMIGASCSPQSLTTESPAPGTAPLPSESPGVPPPTPPASPDLFEEVAYEPADCPADAVRDITLDVSCGYLTVPEDRSASTTRAIQLLIIRVLPDEPPSPDPIIALGFDIPWTTNYPGVAPLATRVHRELIMPAMRGSGRADPSLVCTEIDELAKTHDPLGDDPTMIVDRAPRDDFMAAVQACRDRLVAADVNLAAYNLAESAADIEDLRVALGFESFNLISFGTISRVSFEVMRRYPEHLRSVVFDSPTVPQVDMFTEAILGTRAALEAVSAKCEGNDACDAAYPDFGAAMATAMERLAAQPLATGGFTYPVLLDDVGTLRWIRTGLAGHFINEVPGIIHNVASGFAADIVAAELNRWPILSLGYSEGASYDVSPGSFEGDWSHGLQYSIACREQLPFVDRDALVALTSDEPWYRRAYLDSPFGEICERWDVGIGDGSVNQPVTSSIPALLLVGSFDPFAAPTIVREHTASLATSWLVELPYGHNVLGFDDRCAFTIRNAWVDAPTSPPDTSCVADIPAWSFRLP